MHLFTSIKPPAAADELSYLRDCLESWRAAGFKPVAVNGPSEIKILRSLDLGVEFAPLPADGKPRIGAILTAIRESCSPFAGIINSDCIIGYPGIAGNLQAGLAGRIAIAWRTDIGDGEPYPSCGGFDAFFFDTRYLPSDDCGFSIGESWWDNWFPLACERMGAKVETLPPLLTHRSHASNWDQQQWKDNGRRFWTWLGNPGCPSKGDLHILGAQVPAKFHAQPQTICVTGMPEVEAMLRFAGHAMLEVQAMRKATLWRATRRTIVHFYRFTYRRLIGSSGLTHH